MTFTIVSEGAASGSQSHSLRGTGKRVVQSPLDSESTGRTPKCSVQTPDQIFVLREAIRSPSGPLTCPLCFEEFAVKKSFVRHIRTVIQQHQGTGFLCSICGLHFSRRDILARHEAFQHEQGDKHIQCNVCHQWVRPRSLKGHKQSEACKAALPQAGEEIDSGSTDRRSTVKQFASDTFLSMCRQLHGALDCTLLTAWLLVSIQPWGRGAESCALWMARNTVGETYEIRKLKARIFPALRSALSAPDAATNPDLLDAINILLNAVTMTEGWGATPKHQDAALELTAKQIATSGSSREAFINGSTCDAFHSVLYRAVADQYRSKCEQIVRRTIRVMRTAGYDYISNLSDGFSHGVTTQAIRQHSKDLTPELYFQFYGHEVAGIAEIVSSIGTTSTAIEHYA